MDTQADLGRHYLFSATAMFRTQKTLAEAAISQIDERQLHESLDEHTNCVAVIVKHMAGNMRSRWTDLLESDGEKPWRNRDSEFVDDIPSRDQLMALWEQGWNCLFSTMHSLGPDDLMKQTTIRGHPHTVIEAIHRQMDHYGYHVGQIVQLARHLAKDHWTTLTIPRGQSEQFNQRTWKK